VVSEAVRCWSSLLLSLSLALSLARQINRLLSIIAHANSSLSKSPSLYILLLLFLFCIKFRVLLVFVWTHFFLFFVFFWVLFFPLWGRRRRGGGGERGRSRSSATVENMYRSSKIYICTEFAISVFGFLVIIVSCKLFFFEELFVVDVVCFFPN